MCRPGPRRPRKRSCASSSSSSSSAAAIDAGFGEPSGRPFRGGWDEIPAGLASATARVAVMTKARSSRSCPPVTTLEAGRVNRHFASLGIARITDNQHISALERSIGKDLGPAGRDAARGTRSDPARSATQCHAVTVSRSVMRWTVPPAHAIGRPHQLRRRRGTHCRRWDRGPVTPVTV
jgi:hypothetical protein